MIAKCGILVKDHLAEVQERDLGEVKENQVLVKMLACNMCTTDYQQWLGLREKQGYPMAGGHEGAGIVEQVGSGVKALKPGDLVSFGYPYCGECAACQAGNTFDCQNIDFDGYSADGYKGFGNMSFATYKIADARCTIRVAPDVVPAEAGFVEPVGTAVHGMRKLHITPGETLVVVGGGTMGLVNAQVARAFGANVIVSEMLDRKLDRAREMGFRVIDAKAGDPVEQLRNMTGGVGADIVIGAVGVSKAYEQCMQMLKPQRGKFLIFAAGYPRPELHVDPNEIHYREIQILGTMGGTISDFQFAAELIGKRLVDVSGCLEGQVFGLKDIDAAYAAAATPNTYRVTVDCQDV